jgi:hypothetical protein
MDSEDRVAPFTVLPTCEFSAQKINNNCQSTTTLAFTMLGYHIGPNLALDNNMPDLGQLRVIERNTSSILVLLIESLGVIL